MASHLQTSWRVALGLTVAVTAIAIGGSADAQGYGVPNARSEVPSTGGSLRNAPESKPTDQPATDDATEELATDVGSTPSVPAPSATSADEPPADADAHEEHPSEDGDDGHPNDDQ